MNKLKLILVVGLACLLYSFGNKGKNESSKKNNDATKKEVKIDFDSVTIMDKATGHVLSKTIRKRDTINNVHPGDTIDEMVVDQTTGDITGERLIILKK